MSAKHPSPPEWAVNLTQRLLAEAPESMPFWQIMANAISNERSRCADKAKAHVFNDHELAQATEYGRGVDAAARDIAKDIEDGK